MWIYLIAINKFASNTIIYYNSYLFLFLQYTYFKCFVNRYALLFVIIKYINISLDQWRDKNLFCLLPIYIHISFSPPFPILLFRFIYSLANKRRRSAFYFARHYQRRIEIQLAHDFPLVLRFAAINRINFALTCCWNIRVFRFRLYAHRVAAILLGWRMERRGKNGG